MESRKDGAAVAHVAISMSNPDMVVLFMIMLVLFVIILHSFIIILTSKQAAAHEESDFVFVPRGNPLGGKKSFG